MIMSEPRDSPDHELNDNERNNQVAGVVVEEIFEEALHDIADELENAGNEDVVDLAQDGGQDLFHDAEEHLQNDGEIEDYVHDEFSSESENELLEAISSDSEVDAALFEDDNLPEFLEDNDNLEVEPEHQAENQNRINEINLPLHHENHPRFIRWRNRFMQGVHGRRYHFRRREMDFGRWRNWLLRRLQRESSSSDDDDQTTSQTLPENITFDKNLPIAHSYLGEMEECHGEAYKDQDTYPTLSIIYVHDFVLIPGQTLPLQFSRLHEVAMIRRIMGQPDKTFGIMTRRYEIPTLSDESSSNGPSKHLYDFGCTAEIRSFQDKEEYQVSTVRIVIVGRQKFEVIEKRSQIDGNILAKVKILDDVDLPDLNKSVGMCSKCQSNSRFYLASEGTRRHITSPLLRSHLQRWNTIRHTAWSTAWPPWVYKMYDVAYLRLEIFKELREWNQRLEERNCPGGATDFSFWVITNLPLSDKWKLHLLHLNSAVQRLRCELYLLQKCTSLTCSDCSQKIASRSDVFSMSVSGPMAAYVNPGGVVHETLTLYKATGLTLIGRKSTEHSWFPGYAWTICECRHCRRHMGWKFTATRSNLKPQKFWGLTRSALSPQMSVTQQEGGRRSNSQENGDEPSSMLLSLMPIL